MLAACGGNSDTPNPTAVADAQTSAANSASAAVQSEFRLAGSTPLGMRTTTPAVVINDPDKNLPPYTPPSPPVALTTTTLSFGDFTSYLAAGSTQGWAPGPTSSSITIPAPATNGTGAGDKAVALGSTYATASYEADVTVGNPVGAGPANA